MRFESHLALKYIRTQKRSSLLTICSIIIAVTMMSMLFTGYATLQKCLRNVSCDNNPYHIRFTSVSQEQVDILEDATELKSFNAVKNEDGTYRADLMFKKDSIGDTEAYVQELAGKIGVSYEEFLYWKTDNIQYNQTLMNYDLVNDNARFSQLQSFCIMFIYVIFLALCLRLVIDTAFEVSSKERERQFGVLQSIGATPKQIVKIITAEGLILSVAGIPVGLALGVFVAFLAFRTIVGSGVAEAFVDPEKIDELITFSVSPLMLAVSAVTGLVWVLLSAYGTGMRIIKMPTVEAISSRSNKVRKVKRHSLLGLIFGWTGKLASRNAKRQKKRFVITILSLTLSLTFFASGSVLINSASNCINELVGIVGSDFMIDCGNSYYEPLGYRDIMNRMEESGHFKNFKTNIIKTGSIDYNDQQSSVMICYVTENEYERMFRDKAPVSYDKLNKSGGYVFASLINKPDENIKSLNGIYYRLTADEEYREKYDNFKPEEDYDGYFDIYTGFSELMDEAGTREKIETTFDVTAVGKVDNTDGMYGEEEQYFLVATIEQYENGIYKQYGNISARVSFNCDVMDKEHYNDALKFIENSDDMFLYMDVFKEAERIRTLLASVEIAGGFIIAFIALIAVVNMINIISTGIINRRSEIASMQCVGMTSGQLHKMIVIESIQYTLFSALGAVIICLLLIFGTREFIEMLELASAETVKRLVTYSEPMLKILAGSVVSLVVALITGFVSIRDMSRKSLIELIRSVD